jgi:hypothetical protein
MRVTFLMRAYVMIEPLLRFQGVPRANIPVRAEHSLCPIVTFKLDWREGGKVLLPNLRRWAQPFCHPEDEPP